jgi:hypothetical protein
MDAMTYAASRMAAQRAENLASDLRLRQAQARRLEARRADAAAGGVREADRRPAATADCFGLAGPAT